MSEIKQIVNDSFIERIKRIAELFEKMARLESELRSLDVNLEIRIDPWNV